MAAAVHAVRLIAPADSDVNINFSADADVIPTNRTGADKEGSLWQSQNW